MTRAFTLIELLVVVTIIVVLLALLTPALDKAIYQAELAVCGARMDAIGVGAQVYALDFKRWYPKHPAAGDYPAFMIKHVKAWDFRPVVKGYIDMKHFVDPLAGKVSLDTTVQPDDHQVFASNVIWFGWAYAGHAKGMRKVGDRVTFQPAGVDAVDVGILASDIDMIDTGLSRNSHPDRGGVMSLFARQNGTATSELGTGVSAGTMETSSWWYAANPKRGPVDTNHVYGDGSVARFYDVNWEEYALPDGRMYSVGCNPNNAGSWATRRLHIPKR